MNESLVRPLDRLCRKGMLMCVQNWGKPGYAVLCKEMQLVSVASAAVGMRARAFGKWASSRTVISSLVMEPLSARKSTWVSGCLRWLKKSNALDGRAAELKKAFEEYRFQRELPDAVGAAWYANSQFEKTRNYLKTYAKLAGKFGYTAVDVGITGLIAARTGGLSLAFQLARQGAIDETFVSCCPCCGADVRESMHVSFVLCVWCLVGRTCSFSVAGYQQNFCQFAECFEGCNSFGRIFAKWQPFLQEVLVFKG